MGGTHLKSQHLSGGSSMISSLRLPWTTESDIVSKMKSKSKRQTKGSILRASRDAETVYRADTTFKILIYLLANK